MQLVVIGYANGNAVFRQLVAGETYKEAWALAAPVMAQAYAACHDHPPRLDRLIIAVTELAIVDDNNFWRVLY